MKLRYFALLIIAVFMVFQPDIAAALSKGVVNSPASPVVTYFENELYADEIEIKNSDPIEAYINEDGVNVRNLPSHNSYIVTQLYLGDVVSVTAKVFEEWYEIVHNNEKAYIEISALEDEELDELPILSFEYVLQRYEDMLLDDVEVTEDHNDEHLMDIESLLPIDPVQVEDYSELYAVVSTNSGLNLRAAPDINSEILTTLPEGEPLDIFEVNTGWIGVSFFGIRGYVSSDLISIQSGIKPSSKAESKGIAIIDYAKKFLGVPYVWGGTNLQMGVDCSGFVYSVMRNFGININRNSRAQALNGIEVDRSVLRIGDLVFFDTTSPSNNGSISHVGIYMGGDRFIHSSSSSRTWGVTISSLSEAYYNMRYVTARRIL